MSGLSGSPAIGTVDLYTSNVDQGGPEIGQLIWGDHGKAYRYVKAGEALVVGDVVQGPAIDTQFNDLAVATAAAAGVTQVVLTNGTTAVSVGDFVDGTFQVSVNSASGTNLGDEYTIKANSAAANGASLTVTLDRPLRTALTVSTTKVTIRKSPWMGVVKVPVTTATASIAGVAIYAIASGSYGWIQTHGVCSVITDGTTIAAGSVVGSPSPYTAGWGTLQAAASGAGGPMPIGFAMRATTSGEAGPIFLRID